MPKKKVLVVYYSQTGQLTSVVKSVSHALESMQIQVEYERVQPEKPFPFPWPLLQFFDVFPETVFLDPPAIKPLKVNSSEKFDLVIIAYQVWYLAPSLPITAFMKSLDAKLLLAGAPVITLIACRNMWLMAQETMKKLLNDLGAKLLDNVALVDPASSMATFITTPRWLLTGNKGKTNSILPPAGVTDQQVKNAERFGVAIARALKNNMELKNEPLLKGLKAVEVNTNLIASEKLGSRSFKIWGKLIRKFGPPGDAKRKPVLIIYIIFLIFAIVTIVPLTMLIKTMFKPLWQNRLAKQKHYFEQPSGSSCHRLQEYLNSE